MAIPQMQFRFFWPLVGTIWPFVEILIWQPFSARCCWLRNLTMHR